MRLILVGALFGLACSGSTVGPAYSQDTARQLNGDHRYAHDAAGDIIVGPSDVNEVVVGERDLAGNVHVTTDRWFFERADQLARAQLALAQLAQERALSTEVRQIAARFAVDQQRIDAQLRGLAARRNVALSDQLPPADLDIYQQLAALSGPAFDRAYLNNAVARQREELALWDDVLRTSSDRELARFALDTQPLVRDGQVTATREIERL